MLLSSQVCGLTSSLTTIGLLDANVYSDTQQARATYGLLKKLPWILFGFFPKQRRFGLGKTSERLFIIKSGYLLCYDKEVSQQIFHHPVSNPSEYVDLANREEIKRVICLRFCTLQLHSNSTPRKRRSRTSSISIHVPNQRSLRFYFSSHEEAVLWHSIHLSSQISLTLGDFEILRDIGEGAFGVVQLARCVRDNQLYALKRVIVEGEGPSLVRQFLEERTVLQTVQACPFITKLVMAFREQNELFYVLEYHPEGDLRGWLDQHGPLKDDHLRRVAASLVLAVGELHSHSILHRDIKPENVLLTHHAGKLADFGLSKHLPSFTSRAFSFCGTDLYRPPEMSVNSLGYSRALDWWAVGCVIFEMATGRCAFDGEGKEDRRRRVLRSEPEYVCWVENGDGNGDGDGDGDGDGNGNGDDDGDGDNDNKHYDEHDSNNNTLKTTPSPNHSHSIPLDSSLVELIQGLLKKDPAERLGAGKEDVEEVKRMRYWDGFDWDGFVREMEEENQRKFGEGGEMNLRSSSLGGFGLASNQLVFSSNQQDRKEMKQENDNSPQHPRNAKNQHRKRRQRGKQEMSPVSESELFGFEYDRTVMSNLYHTLEEYSHEGHSFLSLHNIF